MRFACCLSAVLSVLFLAGCSTALEPVRPIDAGPLIEAPVVLNDAMVTLTISDLHGFLDGTGTVVSQISPMMGGSMLKTLLGSKLGDPQLAGVAPSNGLAVVVLSPTRVFAAVEVAPARAASYVESLRSLGLSAVPHDGLLLIAKDAETLVAAGPLAAGVRSNLLAARREPSLRVCVRSSALIAANEDLITARLRQILEKTEAAAVPGNAAGMQKILEAELQLFLSLGRQVESVETTLEPVGGGIHLSKVLQPVAGSRLAACCNAPALVDFNPRIQSGLLPDGVIKLDFCMRNPDALVEFIKGEAFNLSDAMDLDPAAAAQWVETMTLWMRALGSTVCESILTDGGSPVGFTILKDVNDEDAVLEALRNLSPDLAAAGFFRLYKSMGTPVSVGFVENVRQVGGVNVHQVKIDFELENVPAARREALRSMTGDMRFDVALYKDTLIYTSDDGAADRMIGQLKNGAAPGPHLAARTAFPSGGMVYADFDAGGYFGFLSSFLGEAPAVSALVDKFTAVMTGAEPVVMSGYRNSGRLRFCSQIPADLLVRSAQAVQLIAMETMQKRAALEAGPDLLPGPQPAPEGVLKLLDGSEIPLSGFSGKKAVVLDFWASWCGPCRKGLPMVQAVADYFSGRDVVFYAVNLNEDAAAVREFLSGAGVSIPAALDDGTLSEAFGVDGIPHTVVIGKNGNIQAVHAGFSDDLDIQLTAEINAALAE